jgi:hypothetical protein
MMGANPISPLRQMPLKTRSQSLSKEEADWDDADEDSLMDEESSTRVRQRFIQLLTWGSLCLFFIFLVRLVALLLESKPMDPVWQTEFVEVMVNQGVIAFLGFVLFHFVVMLKGKDRKLRRQLRLIRNLAVIPMVGYVLLVPLQVLSSIREISTARAAKVDFMKQSTRLSEAREAILKAKSVEEINANLRLLKQPGLSETQQSFRFPDLRETLLSDNTSKQAALSRELETLGSSFDSIGMVISRMGAALGWAAAFASGAVLFGSRKTVVQQLRRE